MSNPSPVSRLKLPLVTLVIGLGLGYFLFSSSGPTVHPEHEAPPAEQAKATLWTCSMHPQIKLPKPGQCPICFMDLIPLESDSSDEAGPRQLVMPEGSIKLAEIMTLRVERSFPTAEVRMVGKIDYDETRMSFITSWFPGRLDRLFVDYTGIAVKRGNHLVEIYSPELLTAERELIEAVKTAEKLRNGPIESLRRTAESNIEAAKQKLILWGLQPSQVEALLTKGVPSDRMIIYAPQGGIVVEKEALQGMYVETGTRIYTIADLGRLWLKLEAYESDLAWLHYGQEVKFSVEAFPGKTFQGRISFINPVLDEMTRTVDVRVNVENADGELKPGMFVRAVVQSQVTDGGKVVDDSLAGKWISPMHPEIIKDQPGKCDICGMPLVRAESLGFVGETAGKAPLVVPASAPLITGKRAVVYVKVPDRERPTFEGREVLLGPRAGDSYILVSGLSEGEEVVTKGNFKIDSALQIQAKPSMMNPKGGVSGGGHQHGGGMPPAQGASPPGDIPAAFQAQAGKLFQAYRPLQMALTEDDQAKAKGTLETLEATLDAVDGGVLPEAHREHWEKLKEELKKNFSMMKDGKDIEEVRMGFAMFSESLAGLLGDFGFEGATPAYALKCPMAFDNRGARWLQADQNVTNPYFGESMLQCGKVTATLEPHSGK